MAPQCFLPNLLACGVLRSTGNASGTPAPERIATVRGVYTFLRRSTPYPSMITFDAPNREICTVRRIRTNTPLQAFVTLNDPAYVEIAQALAQPDQSWRAAQAPLTASISR